LTQLAEADIATQARQTAASISQNANTAFTRFVEGGDASSAAGRPRGGAGVEPEKKDFWDSFGEAPAGPPAEKKDFWESFGEAPKAPATEKKDFWDSFGVGPGAGSAAPAPASKGSGNVGTAAMKRPGAGAGKKDEDWGEW
jgi:ADP-ribosylation factor GTPase-activating protein 1